MPAKIPKRRTGGSDEIPFAKKAAAVVLEVASIAPAACGGRTPTRRVLQRARMGSGSCARVAARDNQRAAVCESGGPVRRGQVERQPHGGDTTPGSGDERV